MRIVKGEIVLPPNAPSTEGGQVVVEVRDVSLADVASTILAERQLDNVAWKPTGRIRFQISVPEVETTRTLSLRVHLSLDGSGVVKSGDLLTTVHVPVPSTGSTPPLTVPVSVI